MKDILTVAKKELRACFGDKVILMQILLLPFIIVYGYALLTSVMLQANSEPTNTPIKAYAINAPADFGAALSEINITAAPDGDPERYLAQIKDKELDLLVVFPDDFAIAESGAETLSDIEVYFNSTKSSSIKTYSAVTALLTAMQPRIFTVNAADKVYDLVDENEAFRMFLGNLTPLIVFMAVFMICMNLASNSIAGDKEKGFLNTLLVTPIKRSSLAAGKSVTILIVSIIGSISAFVGMAASLPQLASAMEITDGVNYGAADYLILFLGVVTAMFVLAAALLITSTLSKDVKQATTVAPIFMLAIMIPGMLAATDSFSAAVEKLGTVNYVIPVWNSMRLLKDIIELDYSLRHVAITFAVNIVVAALGVFAVGKMFENENIVN